MGSETCSSLGLKQKASLILDLPSKFKKWTPIPIFPYYSAHSAFFGWQSWCQVVIFENRNGSEKTVLDIPPCFSSVLGWLTCGFAEKKVFQTGSIDNAGFCFIFVEVHKKKLPKMVGNPNPYLWSPIYSDDFPTRFPAAGPTQIREFLPFSPLGIQV